MKKMILFLLTLFTISCNGIDKGISEKESLLEHQIDSLKQLNESLTTTHPFLFEKALNLEESDKESAIAIYQTIASAKNGDFWAIESEKRVLILAKEEVKKKKFSNGFDWLWYGDTLELSQQNDKCGEWGGDDEIINIFCNKSWKLSGYYVKKTYDCDDLSSVEALYGRVIPTLYQSKEIELTNQQIALLKEVILELTEHKLNNYVLGGNSGIVNKVQIKAKDDFSKKLYISDYPSFYWNKFHKLKNEILKNDE